MELDKLEIKIPDAKELRIAIILPYFNESLGLELLQNTKEELFANGLTEENIEVIRVAGALEIPLACYKVVKFRRAEAIIALGIIIRGETSHYDLVTENTYQGIMKVQLESGIPISFGVITAENVEQAEARVKKTGLNKGRSAALAALLQTTIYEN